MEIDLDPGQDNQAREILTNLMEETK